jgi:hypothetical protein
MWIDFKLCSRLNKIKEFVCLFLSENSVDSVGSFTNKLFFAIRAQNEKSFKDRIAIAGAKRARIVYFRTEAGTGNESSEIRYPIGVADFAFFHELDSRKTTLGFHDVDLFFDAGKG